MTREQRVAVSVAGIVFGVALILRIAHERDVDVHASGQPQIAVNGIPNQNITGNLSAFTNDVGYQTAAQVAAAMPSASSISGTISVPQTLLSLSTTSITASNSAASMFYACGFNTTNTSAAQSIDIRGNVASAGTLTVILQNLSATSLTGGYTINYKCDPL